MNEAIFWLLKNFSFNGIRFDPRLRTFSILLENVCEGVIRKCASGKVASSELCGCQNELIGDKTIRCWRVRPGSGSFAARTLAQQSNSTPDRCHIVAVLGQFSVHASRELVRRTLVFSQPRRSRSVHIKLLLFWSELRLMYIYFQRGETRV